MVEAKKSLLQAADGAAEREISACSATHEIHKVSENSFGLFTKLFFAFNKPTHSVLACPNVL
jgi:hypothetical protein